MAQKIKILAFAGSLRENSYNKRILKTAAAGAEKAGAQITFVDLRDYPMPIYDEDLHEREGFPQAATDFQKLLLEHDGFLIASPEYNGSLPAALKNPIDWASREHGYLKTGAAFKGKMAAIMTASPGGFGGIRCLGHLRSILSILGVNVLPSEIAVGKVAEMFDGDGAEMTDAKMREILENLGASVFDMLRKTSGEVEVVAGQ